MHTFFRMLRIVVVESWRLLHRGASPAEGWITPGFRALLWFLSLPSTVIIDLLGFPYRSFSRAQSSRLGAMLTDSFVAACVVLEVLFFTFALSHPTIAIVGTVFAAWRIVDICAVLLRMVFFSRPSGWKHQAQYATSRERAVILTLLNYVEMILCYAIIYALNIDSIKTHTAPIDRLSPLYFSGITQMTIGFGDVVPIGGVRLVALSQSLIGILMLTIFVSRFIASLGPVRSAEEGRQEGERPL